MSALLQTWRIIFGYANAGDDRPQMAPNATVRNTSDASNIALAQENCNFCEVADSFIDPSLRVKSLASKTNG
jgi:hypothetical protein